GTPDRSYNATEITWQVDFNKQLDQLNGAVFNDPIQAGQAFKDGTVEIYKLDVQLDGSVKQGEEVTSSFTSTNEDGSLRIAFGDITNAYRVKFKTSLEDEDQSKFQNEATVMSDNV
ncbi:collagen binding domain-containing protein, partial [Anaerobacillus sp. 1_MG-2023]|uniref:collagen binding domain-containing protein n=1 Tax=Anaerobacillus sp. 1_MG-2023 TaxID=3062655 RepID=UPI0026E35E69